MTKREIQILVIGAVFSAGSYALTTFFVGRQRDHSVEIGIYGLPDEKPIQDLWSGTTSRRWNYILCPTTIRCLPNKEGIVRAGINAKGDCLCEIPADDGVKR